MRKRIMCITAYSGGKDEFNALTAWSGDMRKTARSYARKNHMSDLEWVDKIFHPESILKRKSRDNDPAEKSLAEVLANEMSDAEAILVVSRSKHPVEFKDLFWWVDWFTTTKQHSYKNALLEFVFIGEENSYWNYRLRHTLRYAERAGMERILPTPLYITGPGEVSHRQLVRELIEKLHQKDLTEAA